VDKIEKYLSKLFVVSSVYIISLILFGFFIIPGVFQVDEYNFPLGLELFLKITATAAVISVFATVFLIPILKVAQKPKRLVFSPTLVASITFLMCCGLLFLDGLYVKVRSCTGGNEDWYCNVEGKSYVGGLIVSLFLASLVGLVAWLVKIFLRR